MIPALALGALSFGGSLMSGIGQGQAAAKQGRLQSIEDDKAKILNQNNANIVNQARENLGRELLTIPETEENWNNSHSNSASNSSTQNRSWVDVDAMMAAAERSGFNPVTWLNAGGMQAYTQSSSDTTSSAWSEISEWSAKKKTGHNAADAFKMMVPEFAISQASQVPTQYSPMSALGGAISAGANAFGTQFRADQSADLQGQRLAAMALGNINKGMGLSGGNGLMTALIQPGNGSVGGSTGAGGLSSGKSDDKDVYWPGYEQSSPQLWESKKPEATNPFPPSWGWTIPAGYANAETWEDTFGEPVSWPYGMLKFGHTVASNLDKTLDKTPTGGWFQRPVMQTFFGNPNVNSAPWMRSGSAAP